LENYEYQNKVLKAWKKSNPKDHEKLSIYYQGYQDSQKGASNQKWDKIYTLTCNQLIIIEIEKLTNYLQLKNSYFVNKIEHLVLKKYQ